MRLHVIAFTSTAVLLACSSPYLGVDPEQDSKRASGGAAADAAPMQTPPSAMAPNGSGSVDVDIGGPDAADASTSDASVAAKTVFVTSHTWSGDFGGLAQADALCNAAATAAKLPGRFHAWLSDSTHDAKDHIAGNGPWYLPALSGSDASARVLVATDKLELTRGTLAHEIDIDESGRAANTSAWTGSDPAGLRTHVDCTGWTAGSGAVSGTGGYSMKESGQWSYNASAGCVSLLSLYCFEE
jgi:hypothetical protein